MNFSNKGFTLIELMVVVAVIGILASIAVPSYQNYIARSQSSEAFTLMTGAKVNIMENIQSSSCTSTITADNTLPGRYGNLTISGTPSTSIGSTDASGCIMTYTLKSANQGVSPAIAGRTVIASLLNNGVIVKSGTNGTLQDIYIPKSFINPSTEK